MTEKDRKAIFENLEEKRSKPSPAQGNIKGGSGINPGLLPAATSVLFRQRAITAVINSAA